MKRLLLSLASLLMATMPLMVSAQKLTVEYESKINANSPDAMKDAGLPDEMRHALIAAMANVKAVYITYVDGPQVEGRVQAAKEPQTFTFMGQTIDGNDMVKTQLQNITYFNRDTKKSVNKIDLMGKKYLLVDPLKSDTFDVKTNEKKEILGYGKNTIWFTKHIPVEAGPLYANVGGLILEAEMPDNIFVAKKITMDVDHAITEPTGGEQTTEKAFKEMVKKLVDRMRR